jgi:DNA polymerase III subunit delta
MKTDTEIYPVYLLYGTEEFLLEEEIQRLLDRTLSLKERGLNLHLFRGDEHSGQEIVQTAQTLPMFSPFRFVLVRDADQVDTEERDVLLSYIQNPSATTCLVLCAPTLGPWKGHQSVIEKVGKVAEYSRLKAKALASWIRRRMEVKGKRLTEEGADYLMEMVGDNLYALENALEKACLTVGEKGTVELSDIEGIVADVKVSTVFELTDAIGQQNVEKAVTILGKVMDLRAVPFKKEGEATKMGDPSSLLLSMMARQYRMIWEVKGLMARQCDLAEIARMLKMSPWVVRNVAGQSRRFSESSLREGILKCHQTDLALKRGRGPKELLMEKLVIDLCRPGGEKKS